MIGDAAMIVHVLRAAEVAAVGPVLVAAGDAAIVEAVERAGGRAVLTDPALPSGTDRVRAAADAFDPERRFAEVINLQGDMPFVEAAPLLACTRLLAEVAECDIATVVAPSMNADDRGDANVVKAVLDGAPNPPGTRALDFTRGDPGGAVWRHLGLYGYRRAALDRFCAAPPMPRETAEKLEQLRCYPLGLSIWAARVERAPLSVDTAADLEAARAWWRPRG